MLLSKWGFTAEEVWQMSLIEISAWIESYRESVGSTIPTSPKEMVTTYHSLRKPRK